MTLYEKLVAIGARIEHHCSDIYTPYTQMAVDCMDECQKKNATTFHSEGELWLDIPFAYDPAWNLKGDN